MFLLPTRLLLESGLVIRVTAVQIIGRRLNPFALSTGRFNSSFSIKKNGLGIHIRFPQEFHKSLSAISRNTKNFLYQTHCLLYSMTSTNGKNESAQYKVLSFFRSTSTVNLRITVSLIA
jgi:hypothetical protein